MKDSSFTLIEIYSEAVRKIMDNFLKERQKLLKDRARQETRLVLTQNRRVENMETVMLILMKEREDEMEKLNWENSNEKQLKIFRVNDILNKKH